MNGPKHTPGPWKAERRDWKGEPVEHKVYISGNMHESYDEDDDPDDEPCYVSTGVAIVEGNATSHDVTDANARLIAAAPKLLAALDGLVRLLNGPADFTTQQITAAIRAGIEALQEAGIYE